MNKDELARNEQLTDYVVHDLNADPTLPFPDNSYDVITNCVSVDYLNKPLQVRGGEGGEGAGQGARGERG